MVGSPCSEDRLFSVIWKSLFRNLQVFSNFRVVANSFLWGSPKQSVLISGFASIENQTTHFKNYFYFVFGSQVPGHASRFEKSTCDLKPFEYIKIHLWFEALWVHRPSVWGSLWHPQDYASRQATPANMLQKDCHHHCHCHSTVIVTRFCSFASLHLLICWSFWMVWTIDWMPKKTVLINPW